MFDKVFPNVSPNHINNLCRRVKDQSQQLACQRSSHHLSIRIAAWVIGETLGIQPSSQFKHAMLPIADNVRKPAGVIRPLELDAVELQQGRTVLPFRVDCIRRIEYNFTGASDIGIPVDFNPLRTGDDDDNLEKRMGVRSRVPFGSAAPPFGSDKPGRLRTFEVNFRQVDQFPSLSPCVPEATLILRRSLGAVKFQSSLQNDWVVL